MHQSTTPSLSQTIWPRWASRQFLSLPIVETLFPVTFGYSLSSQAVVMRQLRRWKRPWRRSLTGSHKRTSMGHSRSCWNDTRSALQHEEITSKGTRVFMCVLSIKVPIQKKSANLFNDSRIINYHEATFHVPRSCLFFVNIFLFNAIFLTITHEGWHSVQKRNQTKPNYGWRVNRRVHAFLKNNKVK